jgi:hypothetical protein
MKGELTTEQMVMKATFGRGFASTVKDKATAGRGFNYQ